MCHSELELREIQAEMTLCPVKPSGDVEVQRGSNRGSDHGGGDRGGEQAGAQAILELPQDLNSLKTLCPQPLVWFLAQLLLNAWRGDQELQRPHHCCHQCAHGLGA